MSTELPIEVLCYALVFLGEFSGDVISFLAYLPRCFRAVHIIELLMGVGKGSSL